MKANFLFVLFIVSTGFLFSSHSAIAQDGLPDNEIKELNFHQELNLNDDKTLLMESENKVSVPSASSVKETSTTQKISSSKQKSGDKTSGEKEEALSSNFLYLIIQKFKISDILD